MIQEEFVNNEADLRKPKKGGREQKNEQQAEKMDHHTANDAVFWNISKERHHGTQ